MQWLSVILLGVIAGIVSCDLNCFDSESNRCFEEYGKQITSSFDDYCRDQPPYIKCVRDATSKCDTSFVKEAREWYDVTEEACEDGSRLNKDIKENVDCINKATNGACSSEMKLMYHTLVNQTIKAIANWMMTLPRINSRLESAEA
ncbi:uncharacterized protein NPIL_283771 [Nephila pilipes]|uniref:Uncharacterized protein n=1 Tax=Nephila pilipes TaxID=299642 RepID=A0A8X6PUS2_NEPPI|nr:uncharacterized protein NPIL_283771 [Nephila pilipes]